jgi:hypothetical protein
MGMEKFSYFLIGKRFILVTDHKAIEELKRKREFGFSRIQRWFERFEKFDFEIKYRPGLEMNEADALSRSVKNRTKEEEEERKRSKILEIHKKLNHRKTITENLNDEGIIATKEYINKVITGCEICQRKDKKINKTCNFVEVSKPGDRIGMDVLELIAGEKIITAIDYFSRKIFAMNVKTKEAEKVVKFLKRIYCELPFKSVITDNGKEFRNESVENWMKKKS